MERLLLKAKENETVTVSKEQDPEVYFQVVKKYLECADTSDLVRLEALGSAVANLVTIANLLVAAGIATFSKVKNKEQVITYERQGGTQTEKSTVHLRFDLIRCQHLPKQAPSHANNYSCKAYPNPPSAYNKS